MANYNFRLKKISVLKMGFLLLFFGLLSGLFLGVGLFIFLEFSVSSLDMNVGIGGMILLCFVLVPILVSFVSFISGLLVTLVLNFVLKIIKGLDIVIEESQISQI